MVLEIKPEALCMLSRYLTTELHPQPYLDFFYYYVVF
jgi:hypothetical protein